MILLGGPFAAAVAQGPDLGEGRRGRHHEDRRGSVGDGSTTAEPDHGRHAGESGTTAAASTSSTSSTSSSDLLGAHVLPRELHPARRAGLPHGPVPCSSRSTGTSAAGYVGKKAVEKSSPTSSRCSRRSSRRARPSRSAGRWLVVKDARGQPRAAVGLGRADRSSPAARQGDTRIKGRRPLSGRARGDRDSRRGRAAAARIASMIELPDRLRALAGDDGAHRDERRRLRREEGHRPRGLIARAARRAGRRRTRAPRAWPGARARRCRRRPCEAVTWWTAVSTPPPYSWVRRETIRIGSPPAWDSERASRSTSAIVASRPVRIPKLTTTEPSLSRKAAGSSIAGHTQASHIRRVAVR